MIVQWVEVLLEMEALMEQQALMVQLQEEPAVPHVQPVQAVQVLTLDQHLIIKMYMDKLPEMLV